MQTTDCIFCKISKREIKSWVIWEDEKNIAFLTPYPNTPGFTVIATKLHWDSDMLNLPENEYLSILSAAKKVGHILCASLHVKRTGIIIEGMGINHAHVKLIPMHGIPNGPWKPIRSAAPEYHEKYYGYLSSKDGPRMEDVQLDKLAQIIKSSAKNNLRL